MGVSVLVGRLRVRSLAIYLLNIAFRGHTLMTSAKLFDFSDPLLSVGIW